MESRNFKLDTEWNMIHYPNKPNGFGILIIGDEKHFVTDKGSFWTQNEGKIELLKKFKESGYTIFYSNLYGKNWGNDKAVRLARRLYEHVIRSEILNGKIHLLAEGMGALIALKLMDEMGPGFIRTCVLINPIISLKDHLEMEKEHKFFYKNLLKEIATAFQIDLPKVENEIKNKKECFEDTGNIPVRIIHILSNARTYNQSKHIKSLLEKWKEKEPPVSICFLLPEKKQSIGFQIVHFMKKNEMTL
ncbi:hydrolase [Bacillus sp. FJAT-49705]|uniref:Hydrolase n=1 Tax=Cytobacillus citreus TaxID=2833586 RepID=A0ABS5NM33_9BACI|nr:hydrolase [Cytobacillus citreus]MBS4188865.1 hydrolase [Cytobacillus citreus]